jgi:hypothetical protein
MRERAIKTTDRKIDALVCEPYGLTEEEIRVEGAYSETASFRARSVTAEPTTAPLGGGILMDVV